MWDNTSTNSCGVGGGCGTSGGVSMAWNPTKMCIESLCRLDSGLWGDLRESRGRTIRSLGANNLLARGGPSRASQPRPQDCGKRARKPIMHSIYRAQEVYPLSPFLGGGFPKEGGTAWRANNNKQQQTTTTTTLSKTRY